MKEVFVFGSNLKGIHGAGAAKYARENYGAELGVGEGPTGQAYALPTKRTPKEFMPLIEVEKHIIKFIEYAKEHRTTRFLLTPVGTNLAGHTKRDIWTILKKHRLPNNVVLTSSWIY